VVTVPNQSQPAGSDDPWDAPDPALALALALALQQLRWYAAHRNRARVLPAGARDEEARRRLVGHVNDVIRSDTGRWASRRRSLAEGHGTT
jgi:hypothetical protein